MKVFVVAVCSLLLCGCSREASPPYPLSVPVAMYQPSLRAQEFDENCPVRVSPLGIQLAEDGVYVHVLVAGTVDAETLSEFSALLGKDVSTDAPKSILEIRDAEGNTVKLKPMRMPRFAPPFVIPSFRSPPSEAVAAPHGLNARVQVFMYRGGRLKPGQAKMRLVLSESEYQVTLPSKFCTAREWKTVPVIAQTITINEE